MSKPPPIQKPSRSRDLDGDGDVDAGDSTVHDLNRDGRIDSSDDEINDVDKDHDIDAHDRLLREKQVGKQDQDTVRAALERDKSSSPRNSLGQDAQSHGHKAG